MTQLKDAVECEREIGWALYHAKSGEIHEPFLAEGRRLKGEDLPKLADGWEWRKVERVTLLRQMDWCIK